MLCVDLEAHPDGNKLGKLEESALHPTSPFVIWKGECHNGESDRRSREARRFAHVRR